MDGLTALLFIIAAYLFGSFSAAVVVSRAFGLSDPREHGSGNPGATNVLRQGNKSAAALTLLLDMLKGVIPVLAALFFAQPPWVLAAVALAAFLGHLYPVFFGFAGGKGVATGFGVLVTLVWQAGLAMLLTWLAMAAIFRYSSLAALTAAAFAPVFVIIFSGSWLYTGATVLISGLLIWRHQANIQKLWHGEESKIGASRQTTSTVSSGE